MCNAITIFGTWSVSEAAQLQSKGCSFEHYHEYRTECFDLGRVAVEIKFKDWYNLLDLKKTLELNSFSTPRKLWPHFYQSYSTFSWKFIDCDCLENVQRGATDKFPSFYLSHHLFNKYKSTNTKFFRFECKWQNYTTCLSQRLITRLLKAFFIQILQQKCFSGWQSLPT